MTFLWFKNTLNLNRGAQVTRVTYTFCFFRLKNADIPAGYVKANVLIEDIPFVIRKL